MVAEKAAEAAKVEQQARQVKEAEAMEEQAKADALKAIILADERRAKETAETAEAEARAIAAAKREERAKAAARSEDAALSQRTAERAATNRRKRAELAAKAAGISMARLNQLAKSIEPKFTIGRREENEAMALDVAIHAVERVTAIQDVGGFANLGFGEDNFDQTLDSEARKRARALTGR